MKKQEADLRPKLWVYFEQASAEFGSGPPDHD
jgi:hypothetical protein